MAYHHVIYVTVIPSLVHAFNFKSLVEPCTGVRLASSYSSPFCIRHIHGLGVILYTAFNDFYLLSIVTSTISQPHNDHLPVFNYTTVFDQSSIRT